MKALTLFFLLCVAGCTVSAAAIDEPNEPHGISGKQHYIGEYGIPNHGGCDSPYLEIGDTYLRILYIDGSLPLDHFEVITHKNEIFALMLLGVIDDPHPSLDGPYHYLKFTALSDSEFHYSVILDHKKLDAFPLDLTRDDLFLHTEAPLKKCN